MKGNRNQLEEIITAVLPSLEDTIKTSNGEVVLIDGVSIRKIEAQRMLEKLKRILVAPKEEIIQGVIPMKLLASSCKMREIQAAINRNNNSILEER